MQNVVNCFLLFILYLKHVLLLSIAWLDAGDRPITNGGQGSVSSTDVHIVDMPRTVTKHDSLVSLMSGAWRNAARKCLSYIKGLCKVKKFKKCELTREVGGWLQVSLRILCL